MKTYDDADSGLRDQGLEVVVIPYRPPPAVNPRHRRQRTCPNFHDNSRNDDSTDSSPTESTKEQDTRKADTETATKSQIYSPLEPLPGIVPSGSRSPRPEFDIPDVGGNSAPMQFTPRSSLVLDEIMDQSAIAGTPLSMNPGTKAGQPSPKPRENPLPTLPKGGKARNRAASGPPSLPTGKHDHRNKVSAGKNGAASSDGSQSAAANRGHADNENSKSVTKSKRNSGRSKSVSKSGGKPHRSSSNEKLGYLQMAKIGYQELVHAIIRPPRANYPVESLGPPEFRFCDAPFVRKDFTLVNDRGMKIECSQWKRVFEDEEEDTPSEDGEQIQVGERMANGVIENGIGSGKKAVDDWDENNEKGQMYLSMPDFSPSVDNYLSSSSSSSSSSFDNYSCEAMLSDEENVAREDEDAIGKTDHGLQQQQSDNTEPIKSPVNTAYEPKAKIYRKRRRHPVVIYLHGNSSARVEVIPQLGHLLSLGVSVISFDFTGSGKSGGDFVSLGYFEREDLQTVIMHLRASGNVSTIALWGRSMGAATALMYGSRDPTISCMILDSPFTDLIRLSEEMVERGREQGVIVPNFVLTVVLRMIKNSVKHQAGFNIKHLSPISHADRCFIPAMFVAGEHDDFIKKTHSEMIHQRYAGDKNIVIVDGDHNSPRPRFLQQSACLFLQSCMQLPANLELVVPLGANLLAPPWVFPGNSSRGVSSQPGRSWLPLDSTQKPQQSQQSRNSSNHGDSFQKKDNEQKPVQKQKNQSETNSDVSSCHRGRDEQNNAASFLAASAPPDMSERQKEIQSSLFKMLGQQD